MGEMPELETLDRCLADERAMDRLLFKHGRPSEANATPHTETHRDTHSCMHTASATYRLCRQYANQRIHSPQQHCELLVHLPQHFTVGGVCIRRCAAPSIVVHEPPFKQSL